MSEPVAEKISSVPCGTTKRFERDSFARVAAANVSCQRPAGHAGGHEATRGSTAYSWANSQDES